MSGFRDQDTLKLDFNVFYPVEREGELVITGERIPEGGDEAVMSPEEFVTLLPISEIATARRFDLDFYFAVSNSESIEA
jgi:hypothetical protein